MIKIIDINEKDLQKLTAIKLQRELENSFELNDECYKEHFSFEELKTLFGLRTNKQVIKRLKELSNISVGYEKRGEFGYARVLTSYFYLTDKFDKIVEEYGIDISFYMEYLKNEYERYQTYRFYLREVE